MKPQWVNFNSKVCTCGSVVRCVQFLPVSFRMLCMIHAKVPPVAVEGKNSTNAVLRVNVNVPGLG